MRLLFQPGLILLCALASSGKSRPANQWQIGTVLDTGIKSVYTGSSIRENYDPYRLRGMASPYPAGSSSDAEYVTVRTFRIETAEYIYEATHVPRWRWSKSCILTVNAPVRYVLENGSLVVVDDYGREQILQIRKRILKR